MADELTDALAERVIRLAGVLERCSAVNRIPIATIEERDSLATFANLTALARRLRSGGQAATAGDEETATAFLARYNLKQGQRRHFTDRYWTAELTAALARVRQEERERAAKIAEGYEYGADIMYPGFGIAARIRAGGAP